MSIIELCWCVLTGAILAYVVCSERLSWSYWHRRWTLKWMRDDRERAFKLLGADDYPDGDLCDWIKFRMNKIYLDEDADAELPKSGKNGLRISRCKGTL